MNTRQKKNKGSNRADRAFAVGNSDGGSQSSESPSARRSNAGAPPRRTGLIVLFLVISIGGAIMVTMGSRPPAEQRMTVERVNTYDHDQSAFTQGLVFLDGKLYESTGLDRENPDSLSQVKIVDLKTGVSEREFTLPDGMFGEGLTLLNEKLYQLTWKDHKILIYDKNLELLEERDYPGEGWGLTTDGKFLIVSDGSASLKFLEPKTLKVAGAIDVRFEGRLQADLNELEYVDGFVYANVWHADYILKIDPSSGRAVARIDLSGLHKHDRESALNGIAYDRKGDRWFVTGKRWSKLYEVKFVE